MKPATAVAGLLVVAAAGMAVVAFASGGEEETAPMPAATPTTSTEQPAGLQVWAAHGCGSCHTFAPANATGQFAPDLAQSLAGTDAAYIRQSIVEPAAATAAGFSSGGMPEDYGERIEKGDLDQLVAFIEEGVRSQAP